MVKRLYRVDIRSEDAHLSLIEKEKFAEIRLKRFCFLGSFVEPVKLHLPLPKVEECYSTVNYHCKLLDPFVVLRFLTNALSVNLFRHDEAILVLVVYLLGDANINSKTRLREEFPRIITNDSDLFLFCKYAALVHKRLNKKIFCKTIKKAIVSWYITKSGHEITDMFSINRGRNGFTHRALIRMCRISDYILGTQYIYDTFTNTCSKLQAQRGELLPPFPMFKEPKTRQQPKKPRTREQEERRAARKLAITMKYLEYTIETIKVSFSPIFDTPAHNYIPVYIKPKSCNPERVRKQVLAISELRTTQDLERVINLIQQFQLKFEHLPTHLHVHLDVLKLVIPEMTCDQLLRCFKANKTRQHFCNKELMDLCRMKFFENKDALAGERMDPVKCLLTLDAIGVKDPLKTTNNKPTHRGQFVQFTKNLFFKSFGCSRRSHMNVHITINMQNSYMKKTLRNTNHINYNLAALTLAWTFSKNCKESKIFRWDEKQDYIKPMHLPTNDFRLAIRRCTQVNNPKNKQRLITPIKEEFHKFQFNQLRETKWDLFLYIVPAATRGNKKQCSHELANWLRKYRTICRNNAKLVIVDLLRFKQSMRYSATSCENILEICGLDEHTVDLIHNFVGRYFE